MSDERSEGLQGGEGDPGPENFLDSFDQVIGSLPPGDPVRRELLQLRPQILDHQETLREQDLIAYAGTLGMDQKKFAETLEQRRYEPRVDADLAAGFQRGVRGSPVIFVNGRRIDGVPSLQTLTDYVQSELAAKSSKSARSIPSY